MPQTIRNIIILLLCFSTYANAADWEIGGRIGGGISNMDYPGKGKNPSFIFAFEAGIPIQTRLLPFLHVQSGLMFQTNGYHESEAIFTDDMYPIPFTMRDYRITVPVTAKLYPKPSFPLYLSTGIENSFKIKRDFQFSTSDPVGLQPQQVGVPSDYNINFICGVGGCIADNWELEARYTRGLNPLFKHVSGYHLNDFKVSLTWWFKKF